MKSQSLLRVISSLLLIVLVFPAQSWSEEQLCFNPVEAKKLLTEVKFGQLNANKLNVCQQQYSTLKIVNQNNVTLVTGLQADKEILTKLSDDFKAKYIDTDRKLNECKESVPSRATWFLMGVGTTMIVGLITTFLLTK